MKARNTRYRGASNSTVVTICGTPGGAEICTSAMVDPHLLWRGDIGATALVPALPRDMLGGDVSEWRGA